MWKNCMLQLFSADNKWHELHDIRVLYTTLLVLTIALWGKYYFYARFTDESWYLENLPLNTEPVKCEYKFIWLQSLTTLSPLCMSLDQEKKANLPNGWALFLIELSLHKLSKKWLPWSGKIPCICNALNSFKSLFVWFHMILTTSLGTR